MTEKFKGATILSIGTAVPANKISQELHHSILESANGLDRQEKLLLRKVYRGSGIESRYSVLGEFGGEDRPENLIFHPASANGQTGISARMKLFDDYAVNLGEEAVNKCLSKSGFKSESVTHLITFSCTGMSAPGLDIQLVERLGLKRNVERTCINFMGCYAAINAIKTANYIVCADPSAIVMLCGVELCTLHYRKSTIYDQMIANALFADGAAAALITSAENAKGYPGFAIGKFYSEFEPAGSDDMAWRISEFGFDIRLSTYVPALIRENIGRLLGKLFISSGIKKSQIDWFAIHPGGVKILEACENALNISKEENLFSYEVLRNYGNMSSVTILFVLEKYFKMINENPGKRLLACAFGPGLTLESMLLSAEKF